LGLAKIKRGRARSQYDDYTQYTTEGTIGKRGPKKPVGRKKKEIEAPENKQNCPTPRS